MPTPLLCIKGLELPVSLGWEAEERAQKQIVLLDIDLRFKALPKACESDELSDTHCYDQLIQVIRAHVLEKSYRLLEHLTHDLFAVIKNQLNNQAHIILRITKKPPIAHVAGIQFSLGD